MNIGFSKESWDSDRDSVVVAATVDGKKVQCAVSHDFLTAPFVKAPDEATALELFQAQRSKIESLLRTKIEQKQSERDGTFMLRAPYGI